MPEEGHEYGETAHKSATPEVLLHGCSRAEGDNWYRRPGKPGTYSRAVGVIYGSLRCAVS